MSKVKTYAQHKREVRFVILCTSVLVALFIAIFLVGVANADWQVRAGENDSLMMSYEIPMGGGNITKMNASETAAQTSKKNRVFGYVALGVVAVVVLAEIGRKACEDEREKSPDGKSRCD